MRKKIVFIFALVFAVFLLANLFVSNQLSIVRGINFKVNSSLLNRLFTNQTLLNKFTKDNNMETDSFTLKITNTTFEFKDFNSLKPVNITQDNITFPSILDIRNTQSNESVATWTTTLIAPHFFYRIINYFKAQLLISKMDKILESIKSFAESNTKYYGYNIKTIQLENPFVAFKQTTVLKNNIYTSVQNTFNRIETFLTTQNLTKPNGHHFLFLKNQGADSSTIMSGIPSSKFFENTAEIKLLQMPDKGNLLIANYIGQYKDRTEIYNALNNYVTDNNLSKASLSFEDFAPNKLPTSDTSQVEFVLSYPIF